MATAIMKMPPTINNSSLCNFATPKTNSNLIVMSVSGKSSQRGSFRMASSANNVYRANSDHFDNSSTKSNKKPKKSVLTLPNEPSILPQEFTISDVNDSDYFKKDEKQKCWRNKCHFPVRYNKSAKQRMKEDNQKQGGDKKISKSGAHDVWTLLRSMNRFQCQPSPPMSDDGSEYKQKNINSFKNKKNRNTRIYEACHTEEIEYTITSYDVDTMPKRIQMQGANENTNNKIKTLTNNSEINYLKPYENKGKNNLRPIKNSDTRSKTNTKVRTGFKKPINDHGDVFIHETLSKETLRERESIYFPSESTLTQSIGTSIGTAISSQKISSVTNSVTEQSKGKLNFNTSRLDTDIKQNKLSKIYEPPRNDVIYKNARKNKATSFIHCPSKNPTVSVANSRKAFDIPCKTLTFIPATTEITNEHERKISDASHKKNNNIYRGKLDTQITDFKKQKNLRIPKVQDFKRTLANLRFPIVVTDREQLSSFKVNNDGYSQFSGLESEMWPFMKEWVGVKKAKSIEQKSNLPLKASQTTQKVNQRNLKIKKHVDSDEFIPISDYITNCKQSNKNYDKKIKYSTTSDLRANTNKEHRYKQKSVNDNARIIEDKSANDHKKSANLKHFKNKIKKLLHKKTTNTTGTVTPSCDYPDQVHHSEVELQRPMTKIIIKNKRNQSVINVGFTTENFKLNKKLKSCQTVFSKQSDDQYHQNPDKRKRSLTKPKWRNDVIDNVLNKINNGFYYVQQIPQPTEPALEESDVIIPIIRDTSSQDLKTNVISNIPGFDKPLPALEIETLSMNEIAIKQCYTNLTIKFDVIVANSKLQATPGSPNHCKPEEAVKNHPGILKCQTTLLNTVLPAELCSVIPKIMRKFSDTNLKYQLFSTKLNKPEPHLATIKELVNGCESGIFTISLLMSPKLQKIFNSSSSFKTNSLMNVDTKLTRSHGSLADVSYVKNIVPRKSLRIPCNIEIPFMIYSSFKQTTPSMSLGEKNVSNALVTSSCKNDCHRAVATVWKFRTIALLKMLAECTYSVEFPTDFSNQIMNINTVAMQINDKLCNSIIIRAPRFVNYPIVPYKSFDNTPSNTCSNAMSNYQGDNQTYPLCKITKLEEFVKILGSGTTLLSVFDVSAGKKIMSCIIKMQNWVHEIDVKQAMLILLLTNKCNLLDLAKFGPELLKLIAENKITDTSQLEKEINAIKPNISSETGENNGDLMLKSEQKDLFQELCWIAKTAANQSHGIFDENTEETLKLFLEKRKQLNPSFLRAMATYLGLGLLTKDLEKKHSKKRDMVSRC